MAVRERQRLLTTATVFLIAFTVIIGAISQSIPAAVERTLSVTASYLYLNNGLSNEAATIYAYKSDGSWAAIRHNNTADYFEISVDEGSTWNRVTTEDIDSDTTDHGALDGLADDDHSQYHNDTRGDARYFREDEHLDSSAGAGDAGKPIKLDADGNVDATMINDADVSHLNIGDIGTNAHSVVDTHLASTADPHQTVSDTHPPTATEAFSGEHVFDYLEFFNGTILETIDIDITEAAGTVSLELQAEGGGDLTLFFSTGQLALDCTDPVCSVALTAGSDVTPQANAVFVLESNGTLTANTTGFPSAEHAPIATVIVQSAASVATNEPYKVHAHTDHASDSNNQGHQTHIGEWIRSQHATWSSGVVPTLTITVVGGSDTVIFTNTAGIVKQLHMHTFPAFTGTPDMYVINDPDIAYTILTDLNQIEQTSGGVTLANNDRLTFVVWGVVSEDEDQCKLFVNLPSGTYNNDTAALIDNDRFTNFDIPLGYRGTGFLVAAYTVKFQTVDGGTFTLVPGGEVDLRGLFPSITAGGGITGEVEFATNVFRLLDVTDPTKEIAFDASGISTATTRTIRVQDLDGVIPAVGTSFPSNPVEGDLFYHSTHMILFMFDGTDWLALQSFGPITLYVDTGTGADTPGKGFGATTDAVDSLAYLDKIIPATFGGDVTINITGENYAEDWILKDKQANGNYLIKPIGVFSEVLAEATVDSGAQGTAGTQGNIVDAAPAWGDDVYDGLVLLFDELTTTEALRGDIHIVDVTSDAGDIIFIVGTFDAQPVAGDSYTIQDWGTTIDSLQLGAGQKSVELSKIHLDDQVDAVHLVQPFSQLDLYYCKISDSVAGPVVVDQFSRVRVFTSAIEGVRIFVSQSYYAMYGSRHIGGQGTACLYYSGLSHGFITNGSVVDADGEARDAIEINFNSHIGFFTGAAVGYVRVRNADQTGFFGVDINYGSGGSNMSNVQYFNMDTTDTDTDASSWEF